jgi:hypothetical protein
MVDKILKNRIDLQVVQTAWVKHQVKVYTKKKTGHKNAFKPFTEMARHKLAQRGFSYQTESAFMAVIEEFSREFGFPMDELLDKDGISLENKQEEEV